MTRMPGCGSAERGWVWAAWTGWMVVAGMALPGAEAAAKGESRGEVPLAALLDHLPDAQEKKTYQIIQETLAGERSGAFRHLTELQLVSLTPQEALARSLNKNLPIRSATQDSVVVELAVQQAMAVFDPLFVVDLGRTTPMTYHRAGYGQLFRKKFDMKPAWNKRYLDLDMPFTPVDRLGFSERPQELVDKAFSKSTRQVGPNNTTDLKLTIQQQLPWGPQLTLSETTSHRQVMTPGKEHFGVSYNAPWATSVGGSIWVPLPFTKNFGRHAPQEVAADQARLARDRGASLLRAEINAVMLQTDLLYWDLVREVESLVIAIENRRAMGSIAGRTRGLLAADKVTRFNVDQLEAELARARVLEESARERLVTASTSLANYIEDDPDTVQKVLFLPVAFQQLLRERRPMADSRGAYAEAMMQRPELEAAALDIQSQELHLALQINQSRPDLSVTGSYSQGESNAVYGYPTLGESMLSVTDPDQRSASGTLSYRRPLGNRAAKSQVAQAELAVDDRRMARHGQENEVFREVGDATAGVYSARAREDAARRSEGLAALALQTALRLQDPEAGVDSTSQPQALEIAYKQREVVLARGARVSAMVDNKKSESRLLSATGVLPEKLATQTALNAFDQYRIKLLADSQAIPFFSALPPRKDQSAAAGK